MNENKFAANGKILFFTSNNNEICTIIYDKDYYAEYYKPYGNIGKIMLEDKFANEFMYDIYHLMDGKEFLESVLSGCFIDYDGHIAQVYVDGFLSNIGLITDNLTSGGQFYMDADAWIELCNNYKVIVNWANK